VEKPGDKNKHPTCAGSPQAASADVRTETQREFSETRLKKLP